MGLILFGFLRLRTLTIGAYFVFGASMVQAQTSLTYAVTSDAKEILIGNILKLAIDKSGRANEFIHNVRNDALTETRLVESVKNGSLDVMWAGTQTAYEEELTPIRIPLFKGLLGHRIFIIRQGDQARFDRVQTLDDLRQIRLGQGREWGDTVVLKAANLNVVDPLKYESLFHMLDGGRFEAFPRAVHEPWSEVASRRDLNLTVEKRILLVYPFAMYFFVSKDNQELARVIEQGMRNAIADGSYNDIFFANPVIKDALDRSKLKDRIVFRLPNPNMSPHTPFDDKDLWLNLEDL